MKILVIADIHGNAEALAAVLAAEPDFDTVVFLGDTVLAGPQPNETMALLGELEGIFIQGNHDHDLLEPDRLAGWSEGWQAWHQWILNTLDPDGFRLLDTLQPEGAYSVGGLRLYLCHGMHPDNAGYVLPDTPDNRLAGFVAGDDSPIVLFGHSHVQFRRAVGGQE